MLAENELILLEQAIEAFHNETGLRLEIGDVQQQNQGQCLDAIVILEGEADKPFAAEIKKWAQQLNLGAIIEQINRLPLKGLLVADYVNPNMAERLKEQKIQFIDTAGNAYIDKDPLYIYVKGNRPPQIMTVGTAATGRAWTRTGLKVIYALLCNPELAKGTYREIAVAADVALGTVGGVVNDLKAGGYLVDRGNNRRRIARVRDLLDRWVEVYPERLRNKQLIGRYIADEPKWWRLLDIRDYGGYWGGEIAGAEYTQYLIPEEGTVYIDQLNVPKLLQQGRLRKYTEAWYPGGTVWLYQPFWNKPAGYIGLVHPVLAYADLIATGDTRNVETARKIFDDYIAEYIRED